MVEVVLHRIYDKGKISFELPEDFIYCEALKQLFSKCKKKHNDYVLCSFDTPKRPRTTGPESQNHHLNGHIMQLCNETKQDYEVIKYCVKMLAVEQMGYPYKEYKGHIIPQGERNCSTEDCAKLIEASHLLAADLGIILQE